MMEDNFGTKDGASGEIMKESGRGMRNTLTERKYENNTNYKE